jgi:hypothetical protein
VNVHHAASVLSKENARRKKIARLEVSVRRAVIDPRAESIRRGENAKNRRMRRFVHHARLVTSARSRRVKSVGARKRPSNNLNPNRCRNRKSSRRRAWA